MEAAAAEERRWRRRRRTAAAARVLVVSMGAFVAKIARPTFIRTLRELMDQLHDRVTCALHAAVLEEGGYNVSVAHEVVTTFGEVVAALQLEFCSSLSPDHPESFDALRPAFLGRVVGGNPDVLLKTFKYCETELRHFLRSDKPLREMAQETLRVAECRVKKDWKRAGVIHKAVMLVWNVEGRVASFPERRTHQIEKPHLRPQEADGGSRDEGR